MGSTIATILFFIGKGTEWLKGFRVLSSNRCSDDNLMGDKKIESGKSFAQYYKGWYFHEGKV